MTILLFSSVTFSAVARYAFQCKLFIYGFLWALVSLTSVFVHSQYYEESKHAWILQLDKTLCYLIAIYGAYLVIKYAMCGKCTWSIPVLFFATSMYLWYRKMMECNDSKRTHFHFLFHITCMIGHAYIMYHVSKG